MTAPMPIPFSRHERLLKKARTYQDDPVRFFSAVDEAVPSLVRALPVADIRKIL